MSYKISARQEISKELKRLDRIRKMSEKTYIKEFDALDEEKKQWIKEVYSNFDGYAEFSYYRWTEALEIDLGLLKAYAKDKYLLEKLDTSALARIVRQAANECNYIYKGDFFKHFELLVNQISLSFERVAIIPVSFKVNSLLSMFQHRGNERSVATTDFGEFTILAPIESEEKLRTFLNKNHKTQIDNKIDNFDHYKTTSNSALTNKYLITYPVSVSDDRAQTSVPEKFMWFQWIVDFYSTNLKFSETLDKKGENSKHFFDFQKWNNTLSRYPCNFENSFNFEISDESINELRESDFSFVLNLYEQSSDDAFGRLINAIHFFSRGLRSNDNISSLLSYVISIEAIYTDNKGEITANLVKYLKTTTTSDEEKKNIGKNMSDVYKLRSAVMHRGKRWVSKNDVTIAQKLAVFAIRKAIDIYKVKYHESDGTVTNDDWLELLSELRSSEVIT